MTMKEVISSIELTDNVENKRFQAGNDDDSVNPSMDDMTRLKTDSERIVYGELIGNSRTSMRHLSDILHVHNREVRRIVEEMRRKGVRVGFDNHGYYLCRNDREFNEFLTRYMAGAMSRLEIASAMKHNNNGQVYIHE